MSTTQDNKKVVKAWVMYDWANSVYPLVITTAIFPIFYEAITSQKVDGKLVSDKVTFLGTQISNTVLISYVSAVIFLIVSFLSPLLSGIADYSGNKRQFMRVFFVMGSLACMGLYFFSVENIEVSVFIYAIAGIGFWGSLVFYNAFLPEIAPAEDHDRISARGFSFGYFGSSLLLIVCLALVMGVGMNARWAFVITGCWWLFFGYRSYRELPFEVRVKKSHHLFFWLSKGFWELGKVWHQLKRLKVLRMYLFSFFIYSMGVQTVMLMAVYFGTKEIAWTSDSEKTTGLIISVLIIQFIAIAGAYFAAKLSKGIGNIKALITVLVLWCIICVTALLVTLPIHFYIIAGFVGLVMGGVQSLSRSTYAKLLPETKDTASFFSFYDVAEKIGIVIGTASYGFIEQLTGSMRNSIVALVVFFVGGLILLTRIKNFKTLPA